MAGRNIAFGKCDSLGLSPKITYIYLTQAHVTVRSMSARFQMRFSLQSPSYSNESLSEREIEVQGRALTALSAD